MCHAKTTVLSWCIIAALTTAIAKADDRLAPADEYFGALKMSPLEVTNRIADAERGRVSLDGLIGTQDAIEDWAQKYPEDPWIAPREYRVQKLFVSLHTPDGDAEARHCQNFLRLHFPALDTTFWDAAAK